MDINYLYSIINLYLRKEDETHKTNLNITKKENLLEFNFNMDENALEKTVFNLPMDDVNNSLASILNAYKNEVMIINEEYNKFSNGRYQILFKNGRKLSFDGFSMIEINRIRNLLYNINIRQEELRVEELNEEKKIPYNATHTLQHAGFTSHLTLFLASLFLIDVFIIALWIFKSLSK